MNKLHAVLVRHRDAIWFWGRKAGATLCDQGLISGSNFLLTLTLAKWMGPSDYGAYAIVFAIFLLIGNLHQALLLEPMSVFQPSLYAERRREYVGSVLWLHLIVSVLLLVPVGLSVLALRIMHQDLLANAAAGLVPAIPCILLLWSARSASYLDCRPGRAVGASGVYCAILLVSLLGLSRYHTLTPLLTFCMMSTAALGAAIALLVRIRPRLSLRVNPGIREVWTRHWSYGRWSLAAVGVGWLDINSYYLITGSLLGIRETGALAALMSLMHPINHLMAGSSRLLLPYLSSLSVSKGPAAIGRVAGRITIGFVVLTAGYWALISIFRHEFVTGLYGEAYSTFAPYLPAATLCMIYASGTFPSELVLRALKAPHLMLRASCIAATCSLIISSLAVWQFGLIGVFVSTASVSMLHLGVVTLFQRREVKRQTRQAFRAGLSRSAGASGLPVLVYHHVGPRRPGIFRSLTMSPRRFERQIACLARLGYTTPSEKDVLAWLGGQRELPQKSILITFDDAYSDLSEYALPTMMRLGFRALIFVVTGQIGGSNLFDQRNGCGPLRLMSADEIKSWAALGFEFGSHSRHHRDLRSLSHEELAQDIKGSRLDLAELLQRPPLSFAYPYGAFNESIETCVKQDFELVFTIRHGLNEAGTPLHRIRRTVIDHRDTVVDTLCRACWGWSPLERIRKKVAEPVRLLMAGFRSSLPARVPNDV